MTEFTSKSGVSVRIEPSSLSNALELKANIEKALIKNNIDVANIDIDLNKMESGSIDFAFITSISKVLMIIDCDKDVHNSLFKCLQRCLYNEEKIIIETFEPIEARADYYEILMSCIKENLMPFLKTLFSESKIPSKTKKNIQ